MLGSIDAGGTKMNCVIGDEQGNIIKQVQFRTTSPAENMKQITDFFLSNQVEVIGWVALVRLISIGKALNTAQS